MIQFFRSLVRFFLPTLIIPVVFVVGLFTPPTPRTQSTMVFGAVRKDSLLKYSPSPRIIFVGGSNLSFGLNSRLFLDSLGLQPVNTAVHAALGLEFMLASSLPHVRSKDVIIIAPEYELLYNESDYVSMVMLHTIWDIDRSKLSLLSFRQMMKLTSLLPQYVISKLRPRSYTERAIVHIYGVESFNEFGDAAAHWGRPAMYVEPRYFSGALNQQIIYRLHHFQEEAEQKGARVFVTYPCLQRRSFDRLKQKVSDVQRAYKTAGLHILGIPSDYAMADSLLFNTPYHLNKAGVDVRTALLLRQVRAAMHDPLQGTTTSLAQ